MGCPLPLANGYLLSMPGDAAHCHASYDPPHPPNPFDALCFCAMFVVVCLPPTARVKKCTPAQRISHLVVHGAQNKAKAATKIAGKRLNLNTKVRGTKIRPETQWQPCVPHILVFFFCALSLSI